MKKIIVLNNPSHWHLNIPDIEIVAARAYLSETRYAEAENVQVFNLCRSYKYQSTGYYVSLLAEARGHRAIPNITTMQDLKSSSIIRIISDDLDQLIQQDLAKLKSETFVLSIYFGKNIAKQYDELSRKLYNLFQACLLRAYFVYNKKWQLQSITPISIKDIPEAHKPYLVEFATEYFSRRHFAARKRKQSNYDLAILINPQEKEPPSDAKAIENCIAAAEEVGFAVETITRDDSSRIAEFDALFIRETTSVNHHTYRIARRAATEGLVVIDDPESIVRCSNKVYLSELLLRNKIPAPRTWILHKDNIDEIQTQVGFPCVLKKPDSSFSQGVVKVESKEILQQAGAELLEDSDLIIVQEYTPTEYDWRIGVLDGRPIFACKYYMVKGHWQIYEWQGAQRPRSGDSQTLPVAKVPEAVIKTAVKAADLIGNGFYGVDLKQIGSKTLVIEVNDNPSIESGVEDEMLGDELYMTLMLSFLRRVREKRERK